MGSLIITWLIRYGHVLGGGVWVGGYALLAIVLIPAMAKQAHPTLVPAALTTIRLLTYTWTATIVLGLVLMTRTRGLTALSRGGEWEGIMWVGIAMAVALLGIGHGGCDQHSGSWRKPGRVAGHVGGPGWGCS